MLSEICLGFLLPELLCKDHIYYKMGPQQFLSNDCGLRRALMSDVHLEEFHSFLFFHILAFGSLNCYIAVSP